MNVNIDYLQSKVIKAKKDTQNLDNEKNEVVVKLDYCIVQIKESDNTYKIKILKKGDD